MTRTRTRTCPFPSFLGLSLACGFLSGAHGADAACAPAWQGTVIIDGESLGNWTVEADAGSSGSLGLTEGLVGAHAIALAWNIGTGQWVQGVRRFAPPLDLSHADIFGLSLKGGGSAETSNVVAIMFADDKNVFYGCAFGDKERGLNLIDRPLINLPVPRKALWFFFSFDGSTAIDWTRIDRFFIVVKRPAAGAGGGSGKLIVDHVQWDIAADWPRQEHFETVASAPDAARAAIAYLVSQQTARGLLVSWKQEPTPTAWLYDQALALLALTRAGEWNGGTPLGEAALAARDLADFLLAAQKPDGHFARAWRPATGVELVDDLWMGDQAWCVLALAEYAKKSKAVQARAAAQQGAGWIAARIDEKGKTVASTEGNVDAWWALIATERYGDAAKIAEYLLRDDTVWDAEQRRWWRGYNDPGIAMDAATWLSAFARHPLVGAPDRGLAALSFVRRTLVAASDDGTRCGFDGMGPVSIWNEGTAQYVAAGGRDAQAFLDSLLESQLPDGSMQGSPDSWSSDCCGWLSPWSGVAPTSWLYFALTGLPFPLELPVARGDANADGRYDIADPIVILSHLFASGTIDVPCPRGVADANADGAVDIADPIFLLAFLFAHGPAPDRPITTCE